MEPTSEAKQNTGQATAFRRVVWLQIYLPLMAGAILVVVLIALALAASGRGGATTSGMADMALVALLLPAMLLGVIVLAGFVLLAVGVAWLIGWLPERSRKVQDFAAQAAVYSDRITERVAQVIVVPKSVWSAIGGLWARRSGKG